MTPLRQRFLDDLRLHHYAPRTIETYLHQVSKFARHFGRSPAQLGAEQVREYLLHIISEGKSWSLFMQVVCALKLLYGVTLNRPDQVPFVPFTRRPKRLPVVLSPEEVLRVLEAAPAGWKRVILQTIYACGLRLGDALKLQVRDIDSARMVIVLRQAKGHKDRMVPLSPQLLAVLRDYWREYRPVSLLFPGRVSGQPLRRDAVRKVLQRLRVQIKLTKVATPHTLRHSYATHMLEAGLDLRTLQIILGHRSLMTTTIYLHVETSRFRQVPALLDRLMLPAPAAVSKPEARP